MRISVVAASREDDSAPTEALAVARLADRLGYGEVWLGEGATWDSFVLATAVGLTTERVALTTGPVPVSVRDPATIARGAANVEAVVGRPVGVALGTSSVRVVEGVHGRSRAGAAVVLGEVAEAVRPLVGPEAEPDWDVVPAHGFRRRLAPASGPLTVAAFGDRAIAVAARYADRMLLDLVSPDQVRELRAKLDAAVSERQSPRGPGQPHGDQRQPGLAGGAPGAPGRRPTLAAWLPAAVDPDERSLTQLAKSIVGYLTVRGYSGMFAAAGFGDAVELARTGAGPDELLAALPAEAAATVGLVGDLATVRTRLSEYEAAGLDEVAIVPATSGDPAGERTLTALAA